MVFNTGAALLDAIVLAVVSKEREGTYGYRITQQVQSVLDVSDSTLYPVLRRLEKQGCFETYSREYGGRLRKYYRITPFGLERLQESRAQLREVSRVIDYILQDDEKGAKRHDAD